MSDNFTSRPHCEVCKSENTKILISIPFKDPKVWEFLQKTYSNRIPQKYLADAKYEIKKCLKCGFIWQAYILNDELMNKMYNEWIDMKEMFTKVRPFSKQAIEPASLAHFFKKQPHEIKALDFGMGWGCWCLEAKHYGFNVTGLEITKEKMEYAQKQGLKVINDLKELGDQKFDLINTEQVFEHLSDPLEHLKKLSKYLKKGGLLKISVPNGNSIEKQLKKPNWVATRGAIHPLEHISCFTHKSLIKMGELAGLKFIKQPSLLKNRYNLIDYLKAWFGKYYRTYYGTSIYFMKP